MKRFHYFLTANLLLWACSLFMTSCEKEDVPPPIDLNTLCKTFQGQQLHLYVNGVEYFGHTVAFAHNKTTDVENNSSTMFLGISPLWPNVRNYTSSEEYDYEWIEMPVSVEATSNEVFFQGILPIYEKNIVIGTEGYWKNDTLSINVIYRANIDGITDNTFIFDFTDESINLSLLHFQTSAIEFNGQQIPIEEFVTNAMKIMLKVLRQNFNEGLRMTFHTDGSMDMEIKKGSDYIPISGQYHHRLHTEEYGFLQSDYEGVTVFNDLLGLNEASFVELSALCWKIVNNHFLPFRYHLSENGEELYLGIGTQQQFHTYNFFRTWTGINMFPQSGTIHNLSVEETNKVRMLANLLYEKIQGPILLKGIRE